MDHPSSKFVRSTAPTLAQEPVTLDLAKDAIGLARNSTHKNDWLTSVAIPGAREQIEKDAGIACYTGTYVRKETVWSKFCRNWFEVNITPATAIAIQYIASDGTNTTWGSSEYTFDTSGVVPVVRLNDGYSWPTLRGDVNGITLTVTAGYATVALIPAQIKLAVLTEIARLWKIHNDEPADAEKLESAYDGFADKIARGVYA